MKVTKKDTHVKSNYLACGKTVGPRAKALQGDESDRWLHLLWTNTSQESCSAFTSSRAVSLLPCKLCVKDSAVEFDSIRTGPAFVLSVSLTTLSAVLNEKPRTPYASVVATRPPVGRKKQVRWTRTVPATVISPTGSNVTESPLSLLVTTSTTLEFSRHQQAVAVPVVVTTKLPKPERSKFFLGMNIPAYRSGTSGRWSPSSEDDFWDVHIWQGGISCNCFARDLRSDLGEFAKMDRMTHWRLYLPPMSKLRKFSDNRDV